MWILDTDTLSLWLHGHPEVMRQAHSRPPLELAVTIITLEEVLGGWYGLIRSAKDDEKLARAYRSMEEAMEFFKRVGIAGFSASGIARYRGLRKVHRRIGSNDLRIAAIVLEAGATLVTRNEKDFRGIDGLVVENWAS